MRSPVTFAHALAVMIAVIALGACGGTALDSPVGLRAAAGAAGAGGGAAAGAAGAGATDATSVSPEVAVPGGECVPYTRAVYKRAYCLCAYTATSSQAPYWICRGDSSSCPDDPPADGTACVDPDVPEDNITEESVCLYDECSADGGGPGCAPTPHVCKDRVWQTLVTPTRLGCPESVPANGSSCDVDGAKCQWPNRHCGQPAVGECLGGTWTVHTNPCSCPLQTGEPEVTACTAPPEDVCRWIDIEVPTTLVQGRCRAGVWTWNRDWSGNCPVDAPTSGTQCPTDGANRQCSYTSVCSPQARDSASCVLGIWNTRLAAVCPGAQIAVCDEGAPCVSGSSCSGAGGVGPVGDYNCGADGVLHHAPF